MARRADEQKKARACASQLDQFFSSRRSEKYPLLPSLQPENFIQFAVRVREREALLACLKLYESLGANLVQDTEPALPAADRIRRFDYVASTAVPTSVLDAAERGDLY
mmetsp:Transcript_33348/g.67297  ORF Transcript_33348/g.67297 Transcript_33348/m.67297 type:complete len:108 (-) Transcript_33348:315-638(-)